jgi:phosphoenolpyruvate carboxykinase (GTP)
MADYWAHWLGMEGKVTHAPKIFRTNWFRKTPEGKWMWPGFGQNMRVLEWIVKRVNGKVSAQETILGDIPLYEDINWKGLDYNRDAFSQLVAVDKAGAVREFEDQANQFSKFGTKLPAALETIRQQKLAQART